MLDELQLLRKKVSDYIEELKDYLASGAIKEFDGYQRIVGRVDAFRVMEDDLDEMIKRHIDS